MTVGLLRHYIVQPLTARFQGHWDAWSRACSGCSGVRCRPVVSRRSPVGCGHGCGQIPSPLARSAGALDRFGRASTLPTAKPKAPTPNR